MTTPFNSRTATRLRAIIGAQRINLTRMAEQTGKTRGYIDTRLRCITPLTMDDLDLFSDYLGYTPDELIAEQFILHDKPTKPNTQTATRG